MEIFALHVDCHPSGPDDLYFERNNRPYPSLPHRYCPSCHPPQPLLPPFAEAGVITSNSRVPEAESLKLSHPVIRRLRKIEEEIGEACASLLDEYEQRRAAGDPDVEDSNGQFWQHFIRTRAVTPELCDELITALRQALGLPDDRKIDPLSALGHLHITCNRLPVPDLVRVFYGDGEPLLAGRRTIQALQEAALSRYLVFPVRITMCRKLRGQPPPEVQELLVTGHGGIPRGYVAGKDYTECPTCREITYLTPYAGVALDERQWDGADLFRFTDIPIVFATARAREAMERAGLTGITFRPPSQIHKHEGEITLGE
jgi:hypothetical protein